METQSAFTVRYAETDQMGIAHHSNYPIWFEVGRTDFLKQIGASYSTIESIGVLLPLYEMNCRFISPAKYEDDLLIITKIEDVSRVRLGFSYEILNTKSKTFIAKGETMHAWTDKLLRPINSESSIPEIYYMLKKMKE